MLVLKYFDSIFWGLSSAFRNHLVEEKSPWFNAGPFVLSTRILRKILLCILALSLPFHCSSAKVLIKSLMSVYFFSNEISTFQIFKLHSLIFYLNRCEVWQVFCGTEGFLSPRLRERVHPCPLHCWGAWQMSGEATCPRSFTAPPLGPARVALRSTVGRTFSARESVRPCPVWSSGFPRIGRCPHGRDSHPLRALSGRALFSWKF